MMKKIIKLLWYLDLIERDLSNVITCKNVNSCNISAITVFELVYFLVKNFRCQPKNVLRGNVLFFKNFIFWGQTSKLKIT